MSQFSTFVVVFKAHLTLDNCSYFLTGKCFGKLNFNVKDSLIKGAVFAEPGAVELILRDLQSCVSIVFFFIQPLLCIQALNIYRTDEFIVPRITWPLTYLRIFEANLQIERRYDYSRTIYCFENNRTYAHKMKTIGL